MSTQVSPRELKVLDDEKLEPSEAEKAKIGALTNLVKDFEHSEKPHRDVLIQEWKALHLFWNGFQTLLWDAVSKDWVSTGGKLRDSLSEGVDKRAAARIINIYRAHGESIIAALTTGLPKVSFFPFNAEVSIDITTAKGATKLGDKIQKDNDAPLMFIYALFVHFNEGLVFAHNYYEETEEYDEKPIMEMQPGIKETLACEACGGTQNSMPPETMPQEMMPESDFYCAECGNTTAFPYEEETEEEVIVGYDKNPHGKECIQIWGPLSVTVPHHIKNIKYSPYLIWEQEEDSSYLMEMYPDKSDEIRDKGTSTSESRWARRDIAGNYGGEEQLVTHKKVWFQKFAFNRVPDEEIREQLRAEYPDGAVVTFVGDTFIKCEPEDMLKHWTATESPVSKTIHARPPGAQLRPLQRIENELANLALDQVRHSIGQTFANPDVVDFDAYSSKPASPGTIYPAKPNPGESLALSFHQIKAANLSTEVVEFHSYIEKRAQFVTGAFPSIYGGNIQGSRTASEYSEAKNGALQRLSITYKTIVSWWTRTVESSVREFINRLVETGQDVYSVKKVAGTYQNEWIKVADLSGKVGQVEAESSESFPLSKAQQRDLLVELMSMQKDYVDAAIIDASNVGMVASTLGFPDFVIPGAADREKQLREISELLQGTVTESLDPKTNEPILDLMGQPLPPMPSVPTEPDVDNAQIHIAIIKVWANSAEGMDIKVNNPEGYANVIAHLKMHESDVMNSMPVDPNQDPNMPQDPNMVQPPPGQ